MHIYHPKTELSGRTDVKIAYLEAEFREEFDSAHVGSQRSRRVLFSGGFGYMDDGRGVWICMCIHSAKTYFHSYIFSVMHYTNTYRQTYLYDYIYTYNYTCT